MMVRMEQALEKRCEEQPKQKRSVVITLAKAAQDLKGEDLGLVGARELMPGAVIDDCEIE